jgi:hypothetical protein
LEVRAVKTSQERLSRDLAEARALMLRQDYAEALTIYERLDPNDLAVIDATASALISLRRFAEAAAVLERQLNATPDQNRLVTQRLALMYYAMRQDAKAEELLRRRFPAKEVSATARRLKEAAEHQRTAR